MRTILCNLRFIIIIKFDLQLSFALPINTSSVSLFNKLSRKNRSVFDSCPNHRGYKSKEIHVYVLVKKLEFQYLTGHWHL